MATLSKRHKRDIADRVVNHAFKERGEERKKLNTEIFLEYVRYVQGGYAEAIASLPIEFFKTAMYIHVTTKINNYTHTTIFYGEYPEAMGPNRTWINEEDIKQFPEELRERMLAACRADHQYDVDCSDLRTKTLGVLQGVRTEKQLYDQWPELATVVPPKEAAPTKTNHLTVSIKELNELIPLPA